MLCLVFLSEGNGVSGVTPEGSDHNCTRLFIFPSALQAEDSIKGTFLLKLQTLNPPPPPFSCSPSAGFLFPALLKESPHLPPVYEMSTDRIRRRGNICGAVIGSRPPPLFIFSDWPLTHERTHTPAFIADGSAQLGSKSSFRRF